MDGKGLLMKISMPINNLYFKENRVIIIESFNAVINNGLIYEHCVF